MQPVLLPMGVQPSGREMSLLFRFRRSHATRWQSGYSGLICLHQRFHGLQRIANKHVVPGSPQDRNRATIAILVKF